MLFFYMQQKQRKKNSLHLWLDLQSGKLAHVCKGGVGQGVNLVVAQVTAKTEALVYCVKLWRIQGADEKKLTPTEGIWKLKAPLAQC